MNRILSPRIAFLFVAATFLAGCAWTTVTTTVTLPPKSRKMQKKQTVAVIPFKGPFGEAATSTARSMIANGGLHTLIDVKANRKQLAAFKKAGATVYVTGETSVADKKSDAKEQIIEECAAQDDQGNCTRKVTITQYMLNEFCTTSVQGKVVAVADGTVLVEQGVQSTQYFSTDWLGNRPVSIIDDLCDSASYASAEDFVEFVTPYNATLYLKLHDIEGADDDLKKAIALLEDKELEKAKDTLEAVLGKKGLVEESLAWAHYDFAVVLFAMMSGTECIDHLDHAKQGLGKEDEIMYMYGKCSGIMSK